MATIPLIPRERVQKGHFYSFQKSFSIQRVSIEKRSQVCEICKKWAQEADQWGLFEKDVTASWRLFDISQLCERALLALNPDRMGEPQNREFYFCLDAKKNIEGLLILNPATTKELEIHTLITNPKNIASSNPTLDKVKGVGSKLLTHAEKRARSLKVPIVTLEPTLQAKGFYEHQGYHGTIHKMQKEMDAKRFDLCCFFGCLKAC